MPNQLQWAAHMCMNGHEPPAPFWVVARDSGAAGPYRYTFEDKTRAAELEHGIPYRSEQSAEERAVVLNRDSAR